MHISLPLGRIAATAACILLSACATGAHFGADAAMTKPNPALGAFLAARYAESVGDSANAAQFYTTALKSDPQNPELLQDSFLAGLLAGSPVATQLAPRLPGDALAALQLGNHEAAIGHYGAAMAYFKALPDDQLTTLTQPLLLAWLQFGQGHEQEALGLLQPSFKSGPFSAVYRLNAALIADAAGDTKQAAQLYDEAGMQPTTLRAAQILASWYARQGDEIRANAILMDLVAAHPDLGIALPQLRAQMHQPVVATPAQGLAEAYLTMAASLSQTQATFLRTVLLRFALELRPDLSPARLILANSVLGTGVSGGQPSRARIETALRILAPIQPDDPLYGTAAVQEASLEALLGKPEAGIALLNRLLASHPNHPGLLADAGDILRLANQCAQALPYYQKAIALVGTSPPAGAWPLFFDRGVCEDAQGNWALAEPDIQQALKLAPDQPYVLNYLAYRWAQQGKNLKQAQVMLLRAASFDPNDGAVLDSLGFVELKLGNTRQALALLIDAVQLAPTNAEVNAHLGDAFSQAGLTLQAIYQWNRALTMNPDEALKVTLTKQIEQSIRVLTP